MRLGILVEKKARWEKSWPKDMPYAVIGITVRGRLNTICRSIHWISGFTKAFARDSDAAPQVMLGSAVPFPL